MLSPTAFALPESPKVRSSFYGGHLPDQITSGMEEQQGTPALTETPGRDVLLPNSVRKQRQRGSALQPRGRNPGDE